MENAKPVESCIYQGSLIGPVKVECAVRANTIYMRNAYQCQIYGRCLPEFKGPWKKTQKFESGIYTLCHTRRKSCPDYKAGEMEKKSIIWRYGIVSSCERVSTYLPQTVESLYNTGFRNPTIFMDGPCEVPFGMELVQYQEKIGHLLNWKKALSHLYQTSPSADRYALFEDDLLCCSNLREYLNRCPFPHSVYLNLITHKDNESLTKKQSGWHRSNQMGRGAVGLVFHCHTVRAILNDKAFRNWEKGPRRKAADAMIVSILKKKKHTEFIHYPSLIQHVGVESLLGHSYGLMNSFAGVEYDPLQLLEKK